MGATKSLFGVKMFALLLVLRSFFLLCVWYFDDRRLECFTPTVFVGLIKLAGEPLFLGFCNGLFNVRGDASGVESSSTTAAARRTEISENSYISLGTAKQMNSMGQLSKATYTC